MPFYEYECTKCGHQAEILQKISDPPISKCESCKGKMKKLISMSTFHLKGSGWYVTDYASKSGGHDGKSESGDNNTTKESPKETKETPDKSKKDTSSAGSKKAKEKG
ncbi:FmdB family zinc ribbon protein [Thermodesulfobacteriota bacterium]